MDYDSKFTISVISADTVVKKIYETDHADLRLLILAWCTTKRIIQRDAKQTL